MKVEAVLRAKGYRVITIQPWATIDLAVDKLMGPPRIGALVVTGVPRGFTGVVGERNVITGMNTHGEKLLQMRVSEVMVRDVPTCAPSDSVGEVMRLMTRSRHRHVPVMRDDELVGLISIGDVVRARLDEMELEAGVLRDLYVAQRSLYDSA